MRPTILPVGPMMKIVWSRWLGLLRAALGKSTRTCHCLPSAFAVNVHAAVAVHLSPTSFLAAAIAPTRSSAKAGGIHAHEAAINAAPIVREGFIGLYLSGATLRCVP